MLVSKCDGFTCMNDVCVRVVYNGLILYQRFIQNCVFLFQADDGIRDAQESRGLGDV